MAECSIDWQPMTASAWGERLKAYRCASLLQHFPYAQADGIVNQLGARHGTILIDGEEAGLVQLGEAGLLGNLVHVVNLDRGPLWLSGKDTPENVSAFFTTLRRELPRRLGRKMRMLPELEDTQSNRGLLESAGFKRNARFQGYETIWVDLTPELDRLRAKLDGNWRRFLGKAEKAGLEIAEDWTGDGLGAFIATYEADRKAKGYSGPSRKMIEALMRCMAPRGEAVILTASMGGGRPVAALLILLHGTSATYQVGWNLAEGRKVWAHHRLFWHAMGMLKERGITDFDLGGVNDESAQGIKRFKEGMGGRFVRLVGFYS